MTLQRALKTARSILKQVRTDVQAIDASTTGKVYELVCLAHVVSALRQRGFQIQFKSGQSKIKFKASPGPVNHSYPRFDVMPPGGGTPVEIWTDVEFLTLSVGISQTSDLSKCYELDIALVEPINDGERPRHDQIVLGVECKARASGLKETIKQALGIRRELSFYGSGFYSTLSVLASNPETVPANPPSEYWLLHTDRRILNYKDGPAHFGVKIEHLPAF